MAHKRRTKKTVYLHWPAFKAIRDMQEELMKHSDGEYVEQSNIVEAAVLYYYKEKFVDGSEEG